MRHGKQWAQGGAVYTTSRENMQGLDEAGVDGKECQPCVGGMVQSYRTIFEGFREFCTGAAR